MLRPFAVLPLVVVTSTGFPAVAQDSWLTAALEDAQGGPLAETIQMASLKKSQTCTITQLIVLVSRCDLAPRLGIDACDVLGKRARGA